MAENWDSVPSARRQDEFIKLTRSIIHNGEVEDVCTALVEESREDADELSEAVEVAISSADETGDDHSVED